MTQREVIHSIRVEFEELVEEKNSWGKNEVKAVLDKAIANHYINIADGGLDGTVLRKRVVTKKTMNKRALSNRTRNRNKHKEK